MERGPDPITHLALGKYARVGPGRGLVPPETLGIDVVAPVLVFPSLGYNTAFNAAELAAEKFSSCWVWYSSHAAESQISR